MNTTRTALTALTLSAAVLTGCASTDSPPATNNGPAMPAQQWTPGATDPDAGDPTRTPPRAASALPNSAAAVDRGDPGAVATAALTIWFTWDTAVDTGPNDAAARTAPLLTADYAREITSTTAQASPGAQWQAWAAAGAVLIPEITSDDEPVPAQTDSVAYRSYRVAHLLDGSPVEESIVAVILRPGTSGWEVSRIQDK
ncbi:hypothetical protein E5720_17575 [Rhodococcus sp. PAMC28707]|uniref:hypothetical protein n=1 Tax=unclassified Rhodococcus (in: high G+C Gram-positive bacteria) TaxID=192944 RepID=UPI00109DA3E4|nr:MULTISPECIES: hypothetical protein [unclassified Rhodococcus (in: high G+C Gram-positive bacteria)]QCB51803.1 hypothetical protein E5769_17950 [Rhodococcus sp. PAMC28705]QCB60029.1 hypothetical protein E5720_17575 [Rhodococcus sp. PAMC28707]